MHDIYFQIFLLIPNTFQTQREKEMERTHGNKSYYCHLAPALPVKLVFSLAAGCIGLKSQWCVSDQPPKLLLWGTSSFSNDNYWEQCLKIFGLQAVSCLSLDNSAFTPRAGEAKIRKKENKKKMRKRHQNIFLSLCSVILHRSHN